MNNRRQTSNGVEKYVVIGFGWVGQANALALRILGYEVSFFDLVEQPRHYGKYSSLYDSVKKLREPREQDGDNTWYLVCVGDRVSEDGVQDISSIEGALASLKGARGGIILRSTILPDSLENLDFDYYVPEFLHEKNAVEECVSPHFFVVGTKSDRTQPSAFREWRRRAFKKFDGTPREASFIKYLSNLWNALRIAFVNEFGDSMRAPKSKDDIAETAKIIDFVFSGHNYLRYGRSFGGHCLPKDTRAFAGAFSKNGQSLIAAMYDSNKKRAEVERNFPALPEWFSEWKDWHISGWKALSELWYSIKKNFLHPKLLFKKRR